MKNLLFIIAAIVAFQFSSNAQVLEIVNNRDCDIDIDVVALGDCINPASCNNSPFIGFKLQVLAHTTVTYTTLAAAVAASTTPTVITCAPGAYYYYSGSFQNSVSCSSCGGAGLTVGDPCKGILTFGPTCMIGCGITFCGVMSSPFGPGSARFVVY